MIALRLVMARLLSVCCGAVLFSVPLSFAQQGAGADAASSLLVVDCLLPGAVRRLGNSSMLTPRRPVKAPASECEIRGGEYVAYDRADYGTSLAIWRPQAEGGDPVAQTYVGEIYEKGLGIEPDYALAATWYERAAENGSVRAKISLAQLFERGLGVEIDLARALSLYQDAAGLDVGLAIDPASLNGEDNEAISRLLQQVSAQDQQTEALQAQLEQTAAQLDLARQELAARNATLESTRQELAAERAQSQNIAQANDQETTQANDAASELQATLRAREEELRAQERAIERLEQEVQRVDAESRRYQAALGSTADSEQVLQTQVEQQQAEADRLRELLSATTQQLNNAEAELAGQQAETERFKAQLTAAETTLGDQQEIRQSDARRLGDLAASVKIREQEVAKLQAEIERVTEESRRHQESLEDLQARNEVRELPLVGPSLEMIEPSLLATRGLTVAVRSAVEEREIVGRVTAPAGLAVLTVNDESISANDQGIFTSNVGLGEGETAVSVVAVDQRGQKARLDFTLTADEPPVVPPDRTRRVSFGQYHALLIGNNDYQYLPQLKTPVNDVEAIGGVLEERYGFQTTVLRNATRAEILNQLNELRKNLTSEDNLLIYYAGHGGLDDVNNRGNWLPIDAQPDNPTNWIKNTDVTDIINIIAAKHVLVVADSCYSGALTRSALTNQTPGMTTAEQLNWFRALAKKRSRTALTSGGLAPVLDGFGGDHSIFALAILEVLKDNENILLGTRVGEAVAARVAYEAARGAAFEQEPEYAPINYAGHEMGDFLFVPRS